MTEHDSILAPPLDPGLAQARVLDAADPLRLMRDEFCFPPGKSGAPKIYLTGNSLGLQPKGTRQAVLDELDDWARLGVDGHFHARRPWLRYHARFTDVGARLVGAQPAEVVVMNALTVNLHLLMVSFYRPTATRHRIVIERGAFPSDRYLAHSQARFHGYDPAEAVVELGPREGQHLLDTDDVLHFIETQGHTIAVFLLSGLNYYTGQVFDIRRITQAARARGIVVGWDLAHAAGNVELNLHDDDVDFAAWCTYKYLNAGPGAVGMAFVHERHHKTADLPRFAGWWGNDPDRRFLMTHEFEPAPSADGWQLSTAPVLLMAPLAASLALFDRVGMRALRQKSEKLTTFLLGLLDDVTVAHPGKLTVLTPREPSARGNQLSLRVQVEPERFLKALAEREVVCDFRRPDVIRAAPTPLYNSFEDVWTFAEIVRQSLA